LRPRWGAYSASQTPYLDFRVLLPSGGKRRRGEEKRRKGKRIKDGNRG